MIAGKLLVSILLYYSILTFGYLKKKGHSYLLLSLASLAILLIAFSNIMTFSYALNSRIFTNGGFYALSYVLLIYNYNFHFKSKEVYGFKVLTVLSLPLGILFVFTQWSQIGEFTDMRILISPLIYPFIGDEAYSLKELLRNLIP